MSKKYYKRLQRDAWYELKDNLKMYRYTITDKGRIKGFYKDADRNLYSHWLSDKEIEEFNKAHKPQVTNMSFKIPTAADAYEAALDKKYGYAVGTDKGERYDETTVSLEIPKMSDLDIEMRINNVLSREEFIKQINELIINDEKERYIRELLNRLNTIIKYMERASDDDTYQELIIAIAKGDFNTIYDYESYLDEETFEIVKGFESKGEK